MSLDHCVNVASIINQMSFHASNLNITEESLMGNLFIAYVFHIIYTICNAFHHQHVYACAIFMCLGQFVKVWMHLLGDYHPLSIVIYETCMHKVYCVGHELTHLP